MFPENADYQRVGEMGENKLNSYIYYIHIFSNFAQKS